jgi:hypothetical protein
MGAKSYGMEHGHNNTKNGHGGNGRSSSLSVENCLIPSKKIPRHQEIRSCIYACQRHCLAISSSRIWAACRLEKSSRLLLLTSRLRRASSSLRLARWNSSLSACSGPWAWDGAIGRLSPSLVTTWDLDLQYSVQMWSLSRVSIAWQELKEWFSGTNDSHQWLEMRN